MAGKWFMADNRQPTIHGNISNDGGEYESFVTFYMVTGVRSPSDPAKPWLRNSCRRWHGRQVAGDSGNESDQGRTRWSAAGCFRSHGVNLQTPQNLMVPNTLIIVADLELLLVFFSVEVVHRTYKAWVASRYGFLQEMRRTRGPHGL